MKNDTPWPPADASGEQQPLLKSKPETIHVNVLNGTGVKGRAKKVAKQLRKQGFIVEQVGNADTSTSPSPPCSTTPSGTSRPRP